MASEKGKRIGKVSFGVEEKIPGVFGDYSSLGITISLEIPGNVDEFEKEIDAFTKRAVDKLKLVANEVAALSGLPAVWKDKS